MTEPRIAAAAPCEVELEAGKKYWYCTCGMSEKQPFCDGAHKGTDFRPALVEVTENCKRWFCQCKRTGSAPFCDGSHKNIVSE